MDTTRPTRLPAQSPDRSPARSQDRAQKQSLIEESNRVGVEFLLLESQTAMTLLNVSGTTDGEENRRRTLTNAYLAYDVVARLMPSVTLTPEERLELEEKLSCLKTRLVDAGFSFHQ
jgi:hypothetical protein